jgi:hypothetical protein
MPWPEGTSVVSCSCFPDLAGLEDPRGLNAVRSGEACLSPTAVTPHTARTISRAVRRFVGVARRSVERLPIPRSAPEVRQAITAPGREAHHAYRESESLLQRAKRSVEEMTEEEAIR